MEFEWDDAKAAEVKARRDVMFEDATAVFRDPRHVVLRDRRLDYGELRWRAIGDVKGVCITVAYTMRRPTLCRIITAWPSNRKERKLYDNRPIRS